MLFMDEQAGIRLALNEAEHTGHDMFTELFGCGDSAAKALPQAQHWIF